MTTCAQAAQGNLWATGGYIDWDAVESYLMQVYVANAPPVTGQASFQQASQIQMVISSLEMMYGSDLLSSYKGKTSIRNIEKMFANIMSAQNPITAPPGPNSVPSGDAGWWGPADHHIVNSTDFYLCLRRNPTAVNFLATMGYFPCGLEHVLLPSFETAQTTGLQGGGLVGLLPWLEEMAWACAIPGGPCAPTPPPVPHPPFGPPPPGYYSAYRPVNFWGELIGTVAIYEAMRDQVPLIQTSGWFSPPLLQTPMGDRLTEAWLRWRQRQAPVGSPGWTSTASLYFPASPGYAEWGGSTVLADVLTPAGDVAYNIGQDWDFSLHQLARSVQAMYHMGYSFTQADQELVVQRLADWAFPTCEQFDLSLSCNPEPLSRSDPAYAVPSERYGWSLHEGGAECASTSYPNVNPLSPAVSGMAAAAVALVRVGALDSPATPAIGAAAFNLARSLVIALGTLYRVAPSGAAGWASTASNNLSADQSTWGVGPEPRGTFMAIASLFLLARTPALSGILGSSPTANLTSQAGLDSFLHVFGGRLSRTASNHPWASSYVPG